MDLNYQDHEVFRTYINNSLKNKNTIIELLFNAKKCDEFDLNTTDEDLTQYINNLKIFTEYLKENNYFISKWKIRSNNDLFVNNDWFNILDILYQYFVYFKKPGQIFYSNNLSFCNNELLTLQVEKYFTLFNNINVNMVMSYCDYLYNMPENIDKIINFIKRHNEHIYLVVHPNHIDTAINDYQLWKKQIINYDIQRNGYELIPNVITYKNTYYTEEQIKKYLLFIEFLINDRFTIYNYDKEIFINNEIMIKNSKTRFDPLALCYFDKIKDNNTQCPLGNNLVINCKDLSFPTCCGLTQSYFNGGKFLIQKNTINGIVANEGVNGYLTQRIANIFFLPDCYCCKNKYFCNRGCRAAQLEYHTEPFVPIESICSLITQKLTLLIKKYHELGLFDIILKEDKLEDKQQYALIQLLKDRGYKDYEYRYCR